MPGLRLSITIGRPTHKGNAAQTPRGLFSLIADYLEDPAVTENCCMNSLL